MKDYSLLRKTLEHIQANPEDHDQTHWGIRNACGTMACFAGHTVIQAGLKPVWTRLDGYKADDEYHLTGVRMPDGCLVDVETAAQGLLGLTADERTDLFWDAGSLADVEEIVTRMLAEESAEIERIMSDSTRSDSGSRADTHARIAQ